MQLHIKCRSYAIQPTKYNYDFYFNKERVKKAQENLFMTLLMDDFECDESEALDVSQWCMFKATNCFPTHYHIPDDHDPFLSPILPLSLTEECDECVVLGVVFNNVTEIQADDAIAGDAHFYLSPVAKTSTNGSSHRIIGVILLKHFLLNEHRSDPQEVMDRIFNGLECEARDFCIE